MSPIVAFSGLAGIPALTSAADGKKIVALRSLRKQCKRTAGHCHRSAYGLQLGLILPARITRPHFAVSSATSLRNSTGEPPSAVPSRLAICARNLESTSAALIAWLSAATISGDVLLGAPSPKTELAS